MSKPTTRGRGVTVTVEDRITKLASWEMRGYAAWYDVERWLANTAKHELAKMDYPPGPVRTLRDMSEAEIIALEVRYGCPVQRPGGAPGAPRPRAVNYEERQRVIALRVSGERR